MKKTILFCLLMTFCLGMFAQAEDARYNYYKKTITRNADGSTDYNVKFSLTMYTHIAMNETYGQTRIEYNPDYQNVTINEVYTVQSTGKKIPLPDNALVKVLPNWATNAADFNHITQLVVVHTGLDIGCTIYLDYTIHSVAGFNKNLDFNERIDTSSPITESQLTLVVPSNTSLNQAVYSPAGKVAPQKDEIASGKRTIEYSMNDIPAQSRENFQVKDLTKQWRWLSTMSDFETEYKELFCSQIDPTIQTWGEKEVRNEPDVMKRYNYIRKTVADKYVTANIPFGFVNEVRPVSKIMQGAYITPYERALMLNQMLRVCNIKSEVLVSFDPTLSKEFRTMNNVQKFIVTQEIDGKPVMLNPANSTSNDNAALLVGLNSVKQEETTIAKIKHSKELTASASDLNSDGYLLLNLPYNGYGVSGWNMSVLPTLRTVDFEIPNAIDETSTSTIKVEGDLKVSGVLNTSITSSCGAELTETTYTSGDGTITITRHILLPKKVYTVAEYAEIRNIIATWVSPSHNKILFVK